jgi:hypothetical protein
VEFLKRTRWKTYKKGGRQLFGNYLTVIVWERATQMAGINELSKCVKCKMEADL